MTFIALDHKEARLGKNIRGRFSFLQESSSSFAIYISHFVVTADDFFSSFVNWSYSTISLPISDDGSSLSCSNLIIILAFLIHGNAMIYFSNFINSPFVSLFMNISVF